MFATFFGRRAAPEFKTVCDPSTIVIPVDFDAPGYPYEQAFKEADEYVRKLPQQGVVPVSDLLRLQFYSLYKQATVGDINEKEVKQPNVLRDWEGYWKVYGWRKIRGMPREKARDLYIDLLDLQIRKHCTFVWGAPAGEDRWAAFYDGVKIVQNLPKGGYELPESMRAHYYALYKQVHVGDLCDFQASPVAKREKKYKWLRARPSRAGFDQMRYDEWAALKGVSREAAMRRYCKDIFLAAASVGYVWAPPGTPDHLEVVGDQTSAKTLKKRAGADEDAEKIAGATGITMEETMEVGGVKLSLVERLAMQSFMKKEAKEHARLAEEARRKKEEEEAAEQLRRSASIASTSTAATEPSTSAAKYEDPHANRAAAAEKASDKATETAEARTDGGRAAHTDGDDDDDFRSVCSASMSTSKDMAPPEPTTTTTQTATSAAPKPAEGLHAKSKTTTVKASTTHSATPATSNTQSTPPHKAKAAPKKAGAAPITKSAPTKTGPKKASASAKK